MSYSTFIRDPRKDEVWLFEVTGVNLSTGVEKTFYFSSASYCTLASDSLASQRFDARVRGGLNITNTTSPIVGPTYGVLPPRGGGSIVLSQDHGDFETGDMKQFSLEGTNIYDYSFGGRRAVVRHGGYSPRLARRLTYDEFYVWFDGECAGEPAVADGTATFNLKVLDEKLNTQIQPRVFFGCKGAVWLPGSGGSYVSCGTNSAFNFTTTTFTIEFLIYIEANPGSTATIYSRGLSATDGISVTLSTGGKVLLNTYQSGATQTTRSTALSLFKWQRVSVQCGKIYIDGVDSTEIVGTHIAPTTASRTLYWSRDNAGSGLLTGMISDMRVWSALRTEAEIVSRKARPLDSSEYAATGLVGYWPVDDVSGSTVTQKVVATASSDGTLAGSAAIVPSGMGDTDLQGSYLPDVWGWVRNWGPILVDEGTVLYQVHSGSIEEFVGVYIGRYEALDVGAARTSLLELLDPANPTDPGEYDTCITSGGTYIRLGSAPTKPFTLDLKGDNSGGVFREDVSSLVRYILCNRGANALTDPTDLDTDSFDDLEAACTYPVGIVYSEDKSVSDVVHFLLQSAGAVGWFTSNTGKFKVLQFVHPDDGGTPDYTLTENDVVGDLADVVLGPPVNFAGVRWRRNYTVMDSSNLFEDILGTSEEKFAKNEWRTYVAPGSSYHRDARRMVYDTAIDTWAAAMTEAMRQLDIHKHQWVGFRFLTNRVEYDLDRMSIVYFHYQDEDRYGVKQSRRGTSATKKFWVVEASRDTEAGGIMLTLCGKRY